MAHNQEHNIIGTDHTVSGNPGDVLKVNGTGDGLELGPAGGNETLAQTLGLGRNADATGTILTNAGLPSLDINGLTLRLEGLGGDKKMLDWGNQTLHRNDGIETTVVHWGAMKLFDIGGGETVDWDNGYLGIASGAVTIDWKNTLLKDGGGLEMLNWVTGLIKDNSDFESINWISRKLFASDGSEVADWSTVSNQGTYGIKTAGLQDGAGDDYIIPKQLVGQSGQTGLDWGAISLGANVFIKQSIPNEDITVNGGNIGPLQGYMYITETVTGPGGSGFVNINFKDSTGEPFTVQLAYS